MTTAPKRPRSPSTRPLTSQPRKDCFKNSGTGGSPVVFPQNNPSYPQPESY